MNKKLRCFFLLIATMLVINNHLSARTFLIKVDSAGTLTFSPSALSVGIGDTVMWIWVTGTHTVTSDSIPAGETPWSDTLDAVHQTFGYVPHHEGNYSYFCAFHRSMGMTGYFVVGPNTSVRAVTVEENLTISPNPAADKISIHTSKNTLDIGLYDVIGRLVNHFDAVRAVNNAISLDISGVPEGIYMLHMSSGTFSKTVKLTIAR